MMDCHSLKNKTIPIFETHCNEFFACVYKSNFAASDGPETGFF